MDLIEEIVPLKTKSKRGNRFKARLRESGRGGREWTKNVPSQSAARTFFTDKKKELAIVTGVPEMKQLKDTTVGIEYEFFKRYKAPTFSPSWRKRSAELWEAVKADCEHRQLCYVTNGFLAQLQAKLLAKETCRKKAPAAKTVNLKIGLIKTVLNYSVEMQRIPFSPVAEFSMLPEPEKSMNFWTPEQSRQFLIFAKNKYSGEAMKKKRWVFIAYLSALTGGPRAGEIWGLQPQHPMPDRGVIRIEGQLDYVARTFRETKGKEVKFMPMVPELWNELKLWTEFTGAKTGEFLFRNSRGNPIRHDHFYKRYFTQDVAESGLPMITFHQTRDSAGTGMSASGVDRKTIQTIFGHKSATTTDRYVHPIPEKIQSVTELYDVSPGVSLTVLKGGAAG